MKKYILSHDFGTSSDKIVLFSFDGSIVRSHHETYPTYTGPNGESEQDPEDWWKAFCHGNSVLLEGIDPEEVACVAIDGTDPDLICLSADGKAARRSIMWNDSRAKDVVARWNETAEGKGLPKAAVNSVMAKLLWMRVHEPEILDASSLFLNTNHSYILYRLCGKAVCDTDSAIDSGMYDRSSRKWITGLLEEAGIRLNSFPAIVDPEEIIGTVDPAIASECGLSGDTILVGGLPDGSAAAVGTGALLLHNAVLTFGTSAGIMYTAETEGFGFKPGSFSNSAGATYNWLLDTLIGKRDYAEAERRILASSRGAGGVLFLPYLSGERSPVDDPHAKGVWYGLSRSTTKDDLFRGATEGIIMNLSLMLKQIREKGYSVEEMTITGGFSKSDAICQIIADVMNVTLHTLQDPDLSAAIGSAVNAGVAIGLYEDLGVVKHFLKFDRTFLPDPENARYYASRIESFEKLYRQLSPVFPEL